MPKSKRNRVVSLTSTKKKNISELKGRLVNDLRDCAEKYDQIFVFRVQNMRNAKLKQLRNELKDCRFFFGKNKVMRIGLGRTKADEHRKNLHKLSALVSGRCGILFTNLSKDDIFSFFNNYRHRDYARTGDLATKSVQICEGPLKQFSHNLEPYLRQLGMPTTLQKGVIHLLKDFQVCEKGQPLTSEQARILKLMGNQMAEFRVKVEGMLNKNGDFEIFTRRLAIKKSKKDDDSVENSDQEEEEQEQEEENNDDEMNEGDDEDEDDEDEEIDDEEEE